MVLRLFQAIFSRCKYWITLVPPPPACRSLQPWAILDSCSGIPGYLLTIGLPQQSAGRNFLCGEGSNSRRIITAERTGINPAPSVTVHLVSPEWRPAIWALQLHWANKKFHGSLVRPSTPPFTHSFRKQKLCFGFRTWGKTCVLSKSLNIDKLQGPSVSIIHSSINIHSSGCFGQAGEKLRMASGAVLFRSGQNKYGLQAGT